MELLQFARANGNPIIEGRRVTFVPLLQNNGYNITYHEAPAGHNYTFWQNELPQALMDMFGK